MPQQRPPLYKEFLVGVLVGGLLGPLVGWFTGTFATFFIVAAMDRSYVRGMRTSAFVGGLIGIPIGVITGLCVCVTIRVISTEVSFLRNPWVGCCVGAILGALFGYLALAEWYFYSESAVYEVVVCTVVGAATGAVAHHQLELFSISSRQLECIRAECDLHVCRERTFESCCVLVDCIRQLDLVLGTDRAEDLRVAPQLIHQQGRT
jgi:hypothetical protein